jgi:hypothetical protein
LASVEKPLKMWQVKKNTKVGAKSNSQLRTEPEVTATEEYDNRYALYLVRNERCNSVSSEGGSVGRNIFLFTRSVKTLPADIR